MRALAELDIDELVADFTTITIGEKGLDDGGVDLDISTVAWGKAVE